LGIEKKSLLLNRNTCKKVYNQIILYIPSLLQTQNSALINESNCNKLLTINRKEILKYSV